MNCPKNQQPYLTAYLRDGRIELSNNRAERNIYTNSLSKSLIIGGSMVQYSRVIKMASRYKFSEEEIKVIQQRGHRVLKKINSFVQELKETHKNKNIRLMFQDEASFGRINKPKNTAGARKGAVRVFPATIYGSIVMPLEQ